MLEPESADIYRAALEALETGAYLVDRDRRILFWNRAAVLITGYQAAEVIGHFCRDNLLVQCREDGTVQCLPACPLKETLDDGEPRRLCLFLRHKHGHRVPVHLVTAALKDAEGRIRWGMETFSEQVVSGSPSNGAHGGASDSEKRVLERRREHVEPCLARALDAFAVHHEAFGILKVHVDQWQTLRVSHGREAAEAMMGILGETLLYTLNPTDILGRWQEDAFLVIARDQTPRALELDADLLRSMARSAQFRWWGDKLEITTSIGGVMAVPGDSVASLLARAEVAMMRSLERGGDAVTVMETGIEAQDHAGEEVPACLP